MLRHPDEIGIFGARARVLEEDGEGRPARGLGTASAASGARVRALAEEERTRLMQSERAALRAKTALEEKERRHREM